MIAITLYPREIVDKYSRVLDDIVLSTQIILNSISSETKILKPSNKVLDEILGYCSGELCLIRLTLRATGVRDEASIYIIDGKVFACIYTAGSTRKYGVEAFNELKEAITSKYTSINASIYVFKPDIISDIYNELKKEALEKPVEEAKAVESREAMEEVVKPSVLPEKAVEKEEVEAVKPVEETVVAASEVAREEAIETPLVKPIEKPLETGREEAVKPEAIPAPTRPAEEVSIERVKEEVSERPVLRRVVKSEEAVLEENLLEQLSRLNLPVKSVSVSKTSDYTGITIVCREEEHVYPLDIVLATIATYLSIDKSVKKLKIVVQYRKPYSEEIEIDNYDLWLTLGHIPSVFLEYGIHVTSLKHRVRDHILEIKVSVKMDKPIDSDSLKNVLWELYDKLRDLWGGDIIIKAKTGVFGKVSIP